MPAFVNSWLIPLVSIFFIVDPLAAIPAFLTMTAGDSLKKRRDMALKASIATTAILIVFATAGELIFKFFGVTPEMAFILNSARMLPSRAQAPIARTR